MEMKRIQSPGVELSMLVVATTVEDSDLLLEDHCTFSAHLILRDLSQGMHLVHSSYFIEEEGKAWEGALPPERDPS